MILCRAVSMLAAALALVSCRLEMERSATDLLEMTDRSKRSLRSYALPSPDTTAILVFDPIECVTCGAPVGPWKDWSISSPTRAMRLFLTRSPSKTEAAALRVARLTVQGVLRDDWQGTRKPIVVLVAGASLLDSAAGKQGTLRVMNSWVLGGVPLRVTPPSARGNGQAASNWALAP